MSQEIDVVVVGSGIGGLAATLAAHEMGLRPLLLEKAERLGGMTAYSWGLIWVGSNHLGEAAGYGDSRDEVMSYLRYIGAGSQSEERLEALVDRSPVALRFFEEAGIPLRLCHGLTDHYYDFAPGSRAEGRSLEVELIPGEELREWRDRVAVPTPAPYHQSAQELISWGGMNSIASFPPEIVAERRSRDLRGMGAGLVAAFVRELVRRGVEMRVEAPAERLLVDGDRISGVELRSGEQIAALRGVVLACGGYDGDPELAALYDNYPAQIPIGPHTHTGDGITMGTERGAALRQVHNNLQTFLGIQLPRDSDTEQWQSSWWGMFLSELPSPHTFVVNRRGRRFGNEAHFQFLAPKLREFDPIAREYANLPAFLIFDSQFTSTYGFAAGRVGDPLPDWVTRADSAAELAAKLGVDAEGLLATLERFNGFAAQGADDDFGRGSEFWRLAARDDEAPSRLGTVAEPPFYGVELHPTAGPSVGLAADPSARVLDGRGEPIPGLYASGSAACFDEIGVGYQAGLTLASGMTFGHAAIDDIVRSAS